MISKEKKRSGSSTVARTRTAAKEPAMKATNLMVSYRFSKNKIYICHLPHDVRHLLIGKLPNVHIC